MDEESSISVAKEPIPRGSGLLPGHAGNMLVCFEEWNQGVASGQLGFFAIKESREFQGLDGLLFALDALIDQVSRPQRWEECRSIFARNGKKQKQHRPRDIRLPQHVSQMMKEHGKFCSASIRVLTRQNCSIQGEMRFFDFNMEPIRFRSALELMYLLREGLEYVARKKTQVSQGV